MREIKFRAWDKQTEKMYDIDKMTFGNIPWAVPVPWQYGEHDNAWSIPKRCELMQFTGLLDKNGKEIWEGDIVKHPIGKNPLIVAWIEKELAFKLIRKDRSVSLANLNNEYEVIGNIYENPELLEK